MIGVLVALVIGGTGGIGRAIVRRLVESGEEVVFTYLKAEATASALVEECRALGPYIEPRQLDVRRGAQLTAVVEAAAARGLDRLVLGVGSGVPRASLADHRDRHWAWAFETNARVTARAFRAALPHLARAEGSMVVLTSVGSHVVLPNYALVGPAKAAMEATVRYAAWEAGPLGVRVNAVASGLVYTKAVTAYPEYERRLEDTRRQTPLGRLPRPEDIAEVVWWLGTSMAAMITGQTITVDGGWELRCGIEE